MGLFFIKVIALSINKHPDERYENAFLVSDILMIALPTLAQKQTFDVNGEWWSKKNKNPKLWGSRS